MELPDDLLGRLKTGDLILGSDRYQRVGEMDDIHDPQWSKLGVVVRPADFGISSGDQDQALLVYSPEQRELYAVDDLAARLPEHIETVVVCELDPGSTGQAVEGIAGRVGAEHLRTDAIGDRFRASLPQAQPISGIGALPGWEQYRQPTPLAARTCRYDNNTRPCPVHG